MSPSSSTERLEDILEVITDIQDYTEGMALESFAEDEKTVHAVVFEIGVIGEAAGRVPSEMRQSYPEIPWRMMQKIRNVVFHEYFRIDEIVLWETVEHNLPPLIPKLQEILERER